MPDLACEARIAKSRIVDLDIFYTEQRLSGEIPTTTSIIGRALEMLSQLSLAEFRINTAELKLEVLERTAAVTRFRQRLDDYRVTVSPLLLKIVRSFGVLMRR